MNENLRPTETISKKDLLLDFIRKNPYKSAYEIAQGIGCKTSEIASILHQMKNYGYIEQVKGGFIIV